MTGTRSGYYGVEGKNGGRQKFALPSSSVTYQDELGFNSAENGEQTENFGINPDPKSDFRGLENDTGADTRRITF